MTKKLFIFVITAILSVASATAQDVITLRDGNEIQALVKEVGEVNVKYKNFDNPNGPVYTLKRWKIFMIKYADGSKEVFEDAEPAPPTTTPETPPATQPTNSGQNQNNTKATPADCATFMQLKKNDDRMSDFLKKHDEELYKIFHKGQRLTEAGKSIFAPGIVLTSVGAVVMLFPVVFQEQTGEYKTTLNTIGITAISTGMALVITSIPLKIVGKSQKTNAVNHYEKKCSDNKTAFQPSLNIGISENGPGITLKF